MYILKDNEILNDEKESFFMESLPFILNISCNNYRKIKSSVQEPHDFYFKYV